MIAKYVEIDMPALDEAQKQLGFNPTGAVQREATELAWAYMDDFVPSDTTALRMEAEPRDTEVVYGAPGTESNQYANIVHGGVRNGIPMNFQGAPQRGADWEVQMVADRGEQLIKAIQEFADKQKRGD